MYIWSYFIYSRVFKVFVFEVVYNVIFYMYCIELSVVNFMVCVVEINEKCIMRIEKFCLVVVYYGSI